MLTRVCPVAIREPTYRPGLEKTIAELTEAIYTPTDQNEKMAMVALEYRARMVRERWMKQGQN